ncbi:MAG: hypothetical protein Kow0047_14430 [Anaerolineae bacterium]
MKDRETLFRELATALFERLIARPEVVDQIRAAGEVFRFASRDPEVEVTVSLRGDVPQLIFGPSDLRPDFTVSAAARTLHRVWLGEEKLRDALFEGGIDVEGPLLKAMSLIPLFREAERIYPEILDQHGVPRDWL